MWPFRVRSLLWACLSPRLLKRLKAQLINRQAHICKACSLWTSWNNLIPAGTAPGLVKGCWECVIWLQEVTHLNAIIIINYARFTISMVIRICIEELKIDASCSVWPGLYNNHSQLQTGTLTPHHFQYMLIYWFNGGDSPRIIICLKRFLICCMLNFRIIIRLSKNCTVWYGGKLYFFSLWKNLFPHCFFHTVK